MNQINSPVYIFNTHIEAENAIRILNKSGFDMTQLSLVGKGYHSEEQAIGFYTIGDKIKTWGSRGAFWGAIWGLLAGPAVFLMPGIGLVAMAGPFVAMLVGVVEGAVIAGGFSALGAALTQSGMPEDQIIKFEGALKVDKYVLMVHGDVDEVEHARSVLSESVEIA